MAGNLPPGQVLSCCEHPLFADGGQPRGGVFARCEHPLLADCEQSRVGLLAEVEQLPGQSLTEGKRPLPAKGEQLLCSLGVDPFLGPSFDGASLLLSAELAWIVDTWSVGHDM